MRSAQFVASGLICVPMLLAAGLACGQSYPTRLVRIAVGGTGQDITGRIIAQGIAGPLGQPVIVDNRGNGVVASQSVANAPPDGYTIMVAGASHWIFPILEGKAPYDPIRDFSAITMATLSPTLLVVHPSLQVRSVGQLIALAKARPGQLNYGSGSIGSVNHITGELFRSTAHINIVRVSYKNSTPALTDLIAGQIQLMFPTTGSVSQYLQSGRLRALAVTSIEPSPLAPGLPTMAQSGLPGFESVSITGVFAPAKVPEAIIARLNMEISKVLTRPDVKQTFLGMGVETVGGTPEHLAAAVKREMTTVGKLIKDTGIRGE